MKLEMESGPQEERNKNGNARVGPQEFIKQQDGTLTLTWTTATCQHLSIA